MDLKTLTREWEAVLVRRTQENNHLIALHDARHVADVVLSLAQQRLDVLDQRLEAMGLNKEDYWWYRDLRRYGTVPHAGFGLGFERLIAYVTGVQNVRDVIPFPRTPRNASF